jgi:hypothetical protein
VGLILNSRIVLLKRQRCILIPRNITTRDMLASLYRTHLSCSKIVTISMLRQNTNRRRLSSNLRITTFILLCLFVRKYKWWYPHVCSRVIIAIIDGIFADLLYPCKSTPTTVVVFVRTLQENCIITHNGAVMSVVLQLLGSWYFRWNFLLGLCAEAFQVYLIMPTLTWNIMNVIDFCKNGSHRSV